MRDQMMPLEKAKELSKYQLANGFNFEALHEYTDMTGKALYWRIRLKNYNTGEKRIRPMHIADQSNYKVGEPHFPNGKPLYRLDQIISRTKERVIICEGEKCVDALEKIGALATTSGSADSPTKTSWQPLAAREVLIWPDNDTAGQNFASKVEEKLMPLGCNIKKIDVEKLNLPEKGDAVDWLATNPQAKVSDIFDLPSINVVEVKPSAQEPEQQEVTKQSQASVLVQFVTERVELFHDKNSEVYGRDLSTLETRRLDGRQFKDWLVANFYEQTGKSVRDQSLREALSTLSGLARYKGECHDVHIRIAHQSDGYFIDLGESGQSRAILITAESWGIINNPPVRFLRPETLHALPEPEPSNDLSALWKIINISDADQILVIAWLIECLRPDTPFPVLELIGEQGSAKSTTQDMLRRLIDPNACNLRAAPKTTEDIFVSAGISAVVSYENISYLSPPMQDALYTLATGAGFAKRKLYSDADESVIIVKRPVVLNGISAAVTAQDLLDRMSVTTLFDG